MSEDARFELRLTKEKKLEIQQIAQEVHLTPSEALKDAWSLYAMGWKVLGVAFISPEDMRLLLKEFRKAHPELFPPR